MGENVSKTEFLNYLLLNKHGISAKSPPIIASHAEALNSPDFVKEFSTDFDKEALDLWLARLGDYLPVEDAVFKDLIFGMLYSSDSFVKMIRNKDFAHSDVAKLYKEQLMENKKYLAEFNKGERGKINISAPARVVTRFPPEPSGYLHIGHAKAALLNQYMASKGGELIVRFDDTNPEKESIIFEEAILEDLKLLKIDKFRLSHSSDHFDTIFEYAIKMINGGLAYADNTDKDTMREERTNGVASKNRELSPSESLKIFKEMNEGRCLDYCIRAKISIDDTNKAMRDPVIYRVIGKTHHRTGDKYKIYPTYDLAVPIIDSLEGVTLSLRSNEYHDRNKLYYWFIENLSLANKPKIHDFSRLCFDNTVVSKRKMKFYVENGYVEGWDDPRLCTLRGLKRSGMDMDALIEYIHLQGASQRSSVNSWDKIWAINKRTIDLKSARYSAVLAKSCVTCKIVNFEGLEKMEVLRHKKNHELGRKMVFFSDEILFSQEDALCLKEGEEFTLMSWGNAIVESKKVVDGIVDGLRLRLNLTGDYKLTKNKISWVSKRGAMQIKCHEYGALQKDIESEDLVERFNDDSKKSEWWIAEYGIKDTKPGDFIQIERVGFFYCDKEAEFNLVPFTKQKRTY
ncbi:glutamyl-tRNA synthetase [Pancytospora epiphaga]|nr:glutamyl-tRNA synthetase [Pancytospora epiphaga]